MTPTLTASAHARLAMLNPMADRDLERSLARQRAWGIVDLDLKDHVLGKGVLALDAREAERVAALAAAQGMAIHCLSTHLLGGDIELGEAPLRAEVEAGVARADELVPILRPRLVRLLAARSSRPRRAGENAVAEADRRCPWLLPLYRAAAARLAETGVGVVIENEVGGCLLSTPAEVEALFALLGPRCSARYTWDVQNLWQEGTPPTLAVYERLRPFIAYLHLKGGRRGDGGEALGHASALEDATWPVAAIVARACADGVSPVVCLNPSHGAWRAGDDPATALERDVRFAQRLLRGEAA